MIENTTPSSQPTVGDRVANFFKILLRLVFVLVIGIALGVGVYFGIPLLYNRFILPIQENTIHIANLEALHEQDKNQLTQRLDDLQARLEALAVQNDQDKETIAELKAQLAKAQSAGNDLQKAQDTNLDRLEALQSNLDKVTATLEAMDKKVTGLEQAFDRQFGDIQTMQEALTGQDTPVAALHRELQMVKTMELLTRSRMFLLNKDIGLALVDIQVARDLLIELQTGMQPSQAEAIQEIVSRLNLAIANLATVPSLADQDLEVAWQLLMRGIPSEANLEATASITTPETIEVTSTATSTPTPTPWIRPTVTRTPTPTP
jgi:cell division septum initiation protein DivIVA